MPRRLAVALSATLLSTAALAETAPAALQPPSPATPVGSFHAAGVQIYACDASGTWTLKAPEAELSDDEGTKLIHHFAGPSWQATDGSKVVGKPVAKASAPSAGAIPWLLVAATATGPGLLADVRYVQRLDTKGGVAPAGGCAAMQEKRIPYTATYTFYR